VSEEGPVPTAKPTALALVTHPCLVGTDVAPSLKGIFKWSTRCGIAVLGVGGPVQGREQVHFLKPSVWLENSKVMENVRDITEAAPVDAKAIARVQLLRFKRRLGSLTPDQELQIEELVISTVMKISLVTEKVMEALAKNSPR
jgi:hypothetical protein